MGALAYYNENDRYTAEWLRNLIAAKLIAPGDVDERSIVDVRADDLRGYTQCHFFAGIGGWSYALRLAGWPDDRPVWTGSCPCQPFSAAGKGAAFTDERHLWPVWFPLIAERRPAVVFGEQVEAAVRWGWLDLVCADLEAESYAVGAAVLPACGVGAPHIRQRLWFVADAERWAAERHRHNVAGTPRKTESEAREQRLWPDARPIVSTDIAGGVADAEPQHHWVGNVGPRRRDELTDCGNFVGMEHPAREQVGLPGRAREQGSPTIGMGHPNSRRRIEDGHGKLGGNSSANGVGATNRFSDASSVWRELEWLPCTDGKARPTQPGLFPLAHGVPGRMGRLRAFGNAIVPQVAAEFIGAYMEATWAME